jgi:hypothetical protein
MSKSVIPISGFCISLAMRLSTGTGVCGGQSLARAFALISVSDQRHATKKNLSSSHFLSPFYTFYCDRELKPRNIALSARANNNFTTRSPIKFVILFIVRPSSSTANTEIAHITVPSTAAEVFFSGLKRNRRKGSKIEMNLLFDKSRARRLQMDQGDSRRVRALERLWVRLRVESREHFLR